MNRFACNFLERSHARSHFDQSTAAQRDHSALDRLLLQLHGRSADQNQFPDLITVFASSGVNPASISVCTGTSITSVQSLQMRRTSRCAQIRWTEVATRNGSIPMFIRRVIVSGAPLVCKVESTRWPVRAALMAISAVSKSLI